MTDTFKGFPPDNGGQNGNPITPHVHLHGDLFTGEFFTDPVFTLRVLQIAALGQRVLATPKALAEMWGVPPRTVGKHVRRLKTLIAVEGTGYVRELVVYDRLIVCAREAGATGDIAWAVEMGSKLPVGAVSHWRVTTLPTNARKAILERDGEVCAYCGGTEGPFHIDHITPVAAGGTDADTNLCVACAPCNLSKSNKTVEAFKREMERRAAKRAAHTPPEVLQ